MGWFQMLKTSKQHLRFYGNTRVYNIEMTNIKKEDLKFLARQVKLNYHFDIDLGYLCCRDVDIDISGILEVVDSKM